MDNFLGVHPRKVTFQYLPFQSWTRWLDNLQAFQWFNENVLFQLRHDVSKHRPYRRSYCNAIILSLLSDVELNVNVNFIFSRRIRENNQASLNINPSNAISIPILSHQLDTGNLMEQKMALKVIYSVPPHKSKIYPLRSWATAEVISLYFVHTK